MTERTPGLVLPVVVTEVLSPADNAAWYAAWMMAWVLFVVPISIGLTLFAEATHRPDKLRRAVRLGIGCALAIGIVGGLAMAVLAPYLLSLLGEAYATAGTEPLRILLLSVVPLAFTQAYFAISRARRRLGEAIVVGVVSALVSVVAAVVGGMAGGLDGIAVAWTVTQTVTGLVAFQRIRGMWRSTDGTAPSAGFTDSRVD
jgi:O-antigen/teichoic acid export membrane protein